LSVRKRDVASIRSPFKEHRNEENDGVAFVGVDGDCWRWVLRRQAACFSGESPGAYVAHRAKDLAEIVDGGITITPTYQTGLYWNTMDLITFGSCDLDGHLIGLAGGGFGWVRFYGKMLGSRLRRGEHRLGTEAGRAGQRRTTTRCS